MRLLIDIAVFGVPFVLVLVAAGRAWMRRQPRARSTIY